jgi:predicted DNA-binding transcriptional regulator AlpA
MTARAKVSEKKKTRDLPLPGSVVGWLRKQQVCLAMGGCSTRHLDKMVAAGMFPQADRRLGRNPRWSVALVNEWCAKNPEAMEG